jgi:PAS domain S-box-containing protein
MIARRMHHVAWISGVLVVVIGMLAMAGNALGVVLNTDLGAVTMPMNAAIASLAAGTAAILAHEPRPRLRRARAGRACALVAVAIGLATLIEYLANVDLGIDQLLVRIPPAAGRNPSAPGRMAALSALSFVFAGLALVTLDARVRLLRWVSHVLTLVVLLAGLSVLTAYALGVPTIHTFLGFPPMAIHVASALTLFAIAVLLSRPRRGVIATLVQTSPAGTAMRRLLLLSAATLFTVAALRVAGQRANLYSTEFGTTLSAALCAMFIVLVAVWYAGHQRADQQVRRDTVRDERFLLELSDWLRTSARAGEALSQVSARLGTYLGVSRSLFIEIDIGAAQSIVRDDYHVGWPSLAGTYPLSSWRPGLLAAGSAGKTVVIDGMPGDEPDAMDDDYTPRSRGVVSYVAVPLLRRGHWASTLFVSAGQPRTWQLREIVLLQSVAERTWLWCEHLTAMEAQRRREQHLAVILESAFDGIVWTDENGSIVEFSGSAERIFGYRRNDALGRQIAGLLFPGSQLDVQQLAPASDAAGPSMRTVQVAAKHADGTEIAAEITVARVQNGEPPGFTVLIRDVTEHRRAMDQLLLSIEAAPTGMILVDRDGKIALVNAQLVTLFGYPREQLIGQPVELLVPERHRRRHPQLREAFLDDPRFHTMGAGRELFGLHRDGHEIPVAIALNPFHMGTGKFVLSSVVDISERKRTEQALRESEARLRMAQQVAQIGTFEWNIETGSITWTAQLEAMHGLPQGSFAGTLEGWNRLVHPGDHGVLRRGMARAIDTDEVAEAEWRIVWQDGTVRWLAGRWKMFRNDAGKPVRVTGINIDLTERKRVEQDREDLLGQLSALNAELERRVENRTAQLTVALNEREVLLQEVHHRVKNNLQIISSLIRLQIRKISNVDDRRRLQECRDRIEAIALIHEQLYQAQDYSQVVFSDYVKNLVSNVLRASAVAPSVTFALNIESIALPVDKAIPCGLILNELMTNALKHAFPGGRGGSVRIDLRKTEESDVILTVSDDGIGMEHDVAPASPTSLGIRLIEMLIKQLHGRFDVVRGNGMTFEVAFPLANGAAPS